MRNVSREIVAWALLLLVPGALVAGDAGAMMFPSNHAAVNGNQVSQPTAVFGGDEIRTTDAPASLTAPGTIVQLPPQTSVKYTHDELTISEGGARVATSTAMSGRVQNLEVRPASPGAVKYEMARKDGKVMILAVAGKLVLNDGTRKMYLDAGHMATVQDTPNQTQTQDQDKDKDKNKKNKKDKDQKGTKESTAAGAGAGAGAGAATAATTGITLSTAATIGVVAGTAVVASVAGVAAASAAKPKVSP